MDKQKKKDQRLARRRRRVRKVVRGTPDRPRVSIFRSLNHMYVQLIDDLAGTTLCASSTRDKSLKLDKTGNADAAKAVGKALAEKAKAAGVKQVVFDRNGFLYHGRVKAVADGAREGGLEF
ncbi:MAG: 50S ribosomal protein L18 [Planctomycetota bacterium]